MKILIVSDIHANLEALEAISETFDELWVLGDLVNYGPNPSEIIEFVRRNAAVVVRGNHDHAIGFGVDPRCSPAFREMARVMQAYTESVLTDEQKKFLRDLPLTERREVDGQRFLLCHAVPSEPLFTYCPSESPAWPGIAREAGSDCILVGHTHLPFELTSNGCLIVNPGSVGQPKNGRPEACYAIWHDGHAELKSRVYDTGSTIEKLLSLPIEPAIRDQLAGVLRTGSPPH